MLSRLKAIFAREAAAPECFSGLGVVLLSGPCSARLDGPPLSPADLLGVMNEVLSFQTDLILRFDGVVDKCVGDCVIAYWPPRAMPRAVCAAKAAASELVKKKGIDRVSFEMRVSFAAAEFAVAAFGPPGRKQFQAIGRACTRANSMRSRLRGGGVITDAETFKILPPEEQAGFVLQDGYLWRTE